MSTTAVKIHSRRRIYPQAIACSISTAIALWGCSLPNVYTSSPTWKIYSNSRYGFEFPYPSNWTASASPENDDGIAFVPTKSNSVEIRGWAGNQLPESSVLTQKVKTTINHNFQTAQGVSGVLIVEIGQQVSSMTLTLTQGKVTYYWQGKSNSQEFQDYYRLFYYIAQQYKIQQSPEVSGLNR
jgi:hypothetical protein